MKGTEEYKCEVCTKLFSKKFDYLEHTNVHYGRTPFLCSLCFAPHSTVEEYIKHAITHEFHHCKYCQNLFESEVVLDEHKCERSGKEDSKKIAQEHKKKQSNNLNLNLSEVQVVQQNHNSKNHKKIRKKLQCRYCLMSFYSSKVLMVHLQTHKFKSSDLAYKCNYCSIYFRSLKKYKLHKREMHNFACEHCDKQYSSNEKLMKHICFISSNGESFKCSCSKSFHKALDFKLHVGSRPYGCCSCLMQFNSITNLIRHIRTHTKQKPYICKECGRGFSQSANLRNHSSIHLGIRAIKCDKCNFSCKTQSGLFKHKKKHEEGKVDNQNYIDGRKTSTTIFTCPICDKQFLFKRNAGMHMKVHKKKECLCNECGKVFDSKSKLTTHYKACHGMPSTCKICEKVFASSVLLAAHERIHVSNKQFTCSVCHKMFSIKNYLVQHMKTHNEGKQFSCTKCGKLFKVAVSLKYHSKICASLNITL